ncbi:LCP family protein [Nonomuraea sp. NPDC051941]|uniref:LCP family protein n=1 Tax=Nonomuraea sp. NPDC051941 TaxID=3364373 RepID=UPI0037CBD3A2
MIVVLAALAAYFYYRSLESGLRREDVTAALGEERPPETGALNVLLVGSDSRNGDNRKYGATTVGAGERSDTLMLLHISPDRDKATIISFPRDLMATIPACDRRNGPIASGLRQINSAFNDGGIACAMRTVESLTRLRMDHFVKVDFTGFKAIIDALEGIPICLPKPVNDPKAKFVLGAGKHVVNGEQALGYVRARYSLGDGSDLSRIKRQQIFLTQVAKKVTDGGLLTDPGKLNAFLQAAVKAITVDKELTLDEMLEIGRSVKGMSLSALKGITVPVTAYTEDKNRVQLAQPAAEALFARLRADVEVSNTSPSGVAAARPTAPVLAHDQIRLQVLNGSGKVGMAKQAADELATQGFSVISTGNAPQVVVTQIRYGKRVDQGAAAAEQVAARLSKDKRTPIAGPVKPTSSEPYRMATPPPGEAKAGPLVQLVIGADWPGVRVVSVVPDSMKDKTVSSATSPCTS